MNKWKRFNPNLKRNERSNVPQQKAFLKRLCLIVFLARWQQKSLLL